jgi:hypothetical protein
LDKLFDIALSESRGGALLGMTMCSERSKNWVSKFDSSSLRKVGDTLWTDSLAAAPILHEAAESRLAIGWRTPYLIGARGKEPATARPATDNPTAPFRSKSLRSASEQPYTGKEISCDMI